ncbi:hypothetical protein T4D_7444 [Trichinella pseudospiralis]|uniref:SEFIR domain-containing protein n=1 Tax=Trichinella pseudospiralis TaxID=6337 RepID=A0A0V1G2N4_TRIPS|nr:hypothetical protein T4D_7444 [Trichinella pseudospiralis]
MTTEIIVDEDSDVDDNVHLSCLAHHEIPSYFGEYCLADLPSEIQEYLIMQLDVPKLGIYFKNWEWLADSLGMKPEAIKYLRDRVQHPQSPTAELLKHYRDMKLDVFMRIIRDDLQRLDIFSHVRKLLINLKSQQENAPNINIQFPSSYSNRDRETPNVTSSASDMQNADSAYGRASSSATQGVNSSKFGDASSSMRLIHPVSDDCILIVTYGQSNYLSKHLSWLCKNLAAYGSEVIRSDQLSFDATVDLDGFLLKQFNQALAIMIICTPEFRRIVEEDAHDDQSAQVVKFLFRLISAEYRSLGCKNYRFRPVLFQKYSMNDVPSILKNTLIHRWPEQHEQLMDLIFSSRK